MKNKYEHFADRILENDNGNTPEPSRDKPREIPVKEKTEENVEEKPIKVKIRLDFKSTGKSGKFIFGSRSQEKLAEETREQQVAMFRNIPMQGAYVEDIDTSVDVFCINDDSLNCEVAYAPVILTISADTLEDVLSFITREEFRKIQIIKPQNFTMSKHETEKLFFKMHKYMQEHLNAIERKYLK